MKGYTMIKQAITILVALLALNSVGKVSAFAMPSTKPLPQIIKESSTIMIASVNGYQLTDSKPGPGNKPPSLVGHLGSDIFTSMPLKPAGHYSFSVIETLEGKPRTSIEADLPYILSMYYGGAKLPIQSGNKVILFLREGADGKLVPTDMTVPFVPLKDSTTIAKDTSSDLQQYVYKLMVASCSDATIRQANTYLLHNVVSTAIVLGLLPYVNDTNTAIRDNVLSCMATNQQVAVIPRIATLDARMEAQGSGVEAVTALSRFQTAEAVPYLNPLLLSSAYYTRLNVMLALDHLADRRSIPFLMLALRDPDRQNVIPQSAYRLLHQLDPSLGPAFGSDYFTQHRAGEERKVDAWWNDELLGRHLKSGEMPAIPAVIPDTPALLEPLLFVPDVGTRRKVAVRLAHVGDAGSIPYLILALQDPDAQQPNVSVAYVAYKALHRLIPSLSPLRSGAAFRADPPGAAQPIYDWWRDELLGKHLSPH